MRFTPARVRRGPRSSTEADGERVVAGAAENHASAGSYGSEPGNRTWRAWRNPLESSLWQPSPKHLIFSERQPGDIDTRQLVVISQRGHGFLPRPVQLRFDDVRHG